METQTEHKMWINKLFEELLNSLDDILDVSIFRLFCYQFQPNTSFFVRFKNFIITTLKTSRKQCLIIMGLLYIAGYSKLI